MGSSINTMLLGGLALAFSRIIDNSVICLENIYRLLEEGAKPELAAEVGGSEVSMAVLAATLTAAVVFFLCCSSRIPKRTQSGLGKRVRIKIVVQGFVAIRILEHLLGPLINDSIKCPIQTRGHREEAI